MLSVQVDYIKLIISKYKVAFLVEKIEEGSDKTPRFCIEVKATTFAFSRLMFVPTAKYFNLIWTIYLA